MRCCALAVIVFAACTTETGKDPATAERAVIDRFSATAGTLLRRDLRPTLPDPDEWVDFDRPPFLVRGFGPDGALVGWYDWDVRPTVPAPIYVFFHRGFPTPVKDQLNVVDVIPGDPGYNDMWQVVRVEVPDDYVANTVTSLDDIEARGFARTTTPELVNCPVVSRGSVARRRLPGDYAQIHLGWYRGLLIQYFHFGERPLAPDARGEVAVSDAFAAYAINPDQPGGGPPSGWKDDGAGRTHNVLATVPADPTYSPYRTLRTYDVAAFPDVTDLASAMAAPPIAGEPVVVNWPVVELGEPR
ncbi:MAG TPA: hypothetical protein VM734_09665 [Kofleriaceae bacterium]|nr:hypothetical protein [Kofleriaceae bacterium]